MYAATTYGTDSAGTDSIRTIGGSFKVYTSVIDPAVKLLVDSFGNVSINGSVKINNYSLPLFNNGSFSGAAIAIPVNFTSSSYNSVEIKVQYYVSNICNVILSGNTSSNGSGTSLTVQES